MAMRDIVYWPQKVLVEPTKPVTDFGPALEALLEDMLDSVKEAEGIGIAANQIGVPLRVALVGREDGTFFEIVNPTVLAKDGDVLLEEGCLSVPGQYDKVKRHTKVKVRYQDKTGAWQEQEAEGRLAHVFQHEIDHLDGTVFVEHLSALRRGLMLDKMKRIKRSRSGGGGAGEPDPSPKKKRS